MEQLINIVDNNYKYAPGLPTYGLPGVAGQNGSDGSVVFYTNVVLSKWNGTEEEIIDENVSMIKSLMDKGYYPRTDVVQLLNRNIADGDLFITPAGKLYRFNASLSTMIYLIQLKNFGSQLRDNNTLGWSLPENWDITDNVNNIFNSESNSSHEYALLNIQNNTSKTDENQFIRLTAVNQGNVDSLYTYFDNEANVFKLKADKPIVVNSDVYVKYTDDNVIKRSENYSQILTENDPITNFISVCKSLTWNLSNFNDSDLFNYTEINTFEYKQHVGDDAYIEFNDESFGNLIRNPFIYSELDLSNTDYVQTNNAYCVFTFVQTGVSPSIKLHIPGSIHDNDLEYSVILDDFLNKGFQSEYWNAYNNTDKLNDSNKSLYWVTYDLPIGGITKKELKLSRVNTLDGNIAESIKNYEAATNIEENPVRLYVDEDSSSNIQNAEITIKDLISFPEIQERNMVCVKIPYIKGMVFELIQCELVENNKSYIIVNVQESIDKSQMKNKHIHKLNIFMNVKDLYDFEYKRRMLQNKLIKIVLNDGSELFTKSDAFVQYDFIVSKNNKNTIDCYIDETNHDILYIQNKNV